MPRRTQAQIIFDDAQNFLNSDHQSVAHVTARSIRKTRRENEKLQNYDIHLTRLRHRRNTRNRRGKTYTIGELGSATDPHPEKWLLHILKQFKGKRIRIVAYNFENNLLVRAIDGGGYLSNMWELNMFPVVTRSITNGNGDRTRDGEILCPIKVGDRTYSVPSGGNNIINRYFKGKDGAGFNATDWLFTYPWCQAYPEPLLHPGDIVRVYVADEVVAQHGSPQYFAQGVSHCLIQPIINDLKTKRDELKKPSKQSLSNYNCAIDKLQNYATKYSDGIPVPALHRMVEDVSTTEKEINIEVKVPCAKKGEDQFLRIDNQYGHGKVYEFVNWRFDHVDSLASTYKDYKNVTEMSRDQIVEKIRDLTNADEFVEWTTDSQGPVCLYTANETYKCHVDFGERYIEFCEQFNGYRIDHIQDALLSKFVLEGVHYCCTAMCNAAERDDRLQCYDMCKSYATFYESRFYDECMFPGKLTDVYPIDRVMGPGLYRIDGLNWDTANSKFRRICEMQGNPIRNGSVYALPILKCLDSFGVTYNITMGCWAGGTKTKVDFRFTDELIDNKDYALIVGIWNNLKHEHITCIKGSKTFASHLKATSDNCDSFWFPKTENEKWNGDDGIIQIRYPSKHVWHLSQFTSYINAYEFTKMADQLMEVDIDKVIQIQKDDFICKEHEFKLLSYMQDKSNELYETDGTTTKLDRKLAYTEDEHAFGSCCYLSGIDENDNDLNSVFADIEKHARIHSERFSHIDIQKIIPSPVLSLDGSGGTGKTDFLLRNKLLQRKVYIAQSHKLCRAKAHEYKLVFSGDCQLEQIEAELRDITAFKKKQLKHRGEIVLQVTVWARAFHDSNLIWDVIHRYANVLIFDEVSMLHNESVTFLIDRFKEHKIYLCPRPPSQPIGVNAGDFVVFPDGMTCTWDVTEAIEKHYNFV